MTAQLVLALALAAPPPEGAVVGRLAIYEGRTLASLQRVQDVLRRPVSLSLRRGRQVYDAQLDWEGFFVARAPPGLYRLEYVGLGDRAELIVPQDVEVRAEEMLCAGTLAVSVPRLELLGEGTASRFTVVDDCARILPYLKRQTGWTGSLGVRLPSRAPAEEGGPRALSVPDLLCGLRAEASVNGTELALRGWYVYPILAGIGDPGAVTLHLSFAKLTGPGPGFGSEVAVGPGVDVLGLVELIGVAGLRLGFEGFPTEPQVALIARAGFYGAGFDLRAQWTPAGPALFFGVDVAPFFLIGSVL